MLSKNYTRRFFSILLFIGFFVAPNFLIGQSLTLDYVNPPKLDVCDSAKFEVSLVADSIPINDLSVEIWFPKGISYSVGSVDNASELDVTNPERPSFQLPNLSPGEEISFTVWAFGDCNLIPAINSGKLFSNTITATFEGGEDRIITQPYLVETGLLVITQLDPETADGEFGDVITRNIRIRNTRLGKIKRFTFSDLHDPGFSITTTGQNVTQTDVLYTAEFNEINFRTIGNGDDFFDLDEEIVIAEKILITDCGSPEIQNISVLTASWGCQGETCQSTTRVATLNILEFSKQPNLSFTPLIEVPPNFCVDQTYNEKLKITNSGNSRVKNFQIKLLPPPVTGRRKSGMVISSLTGDSSGTNLNLNIVNQVPVFFSDCPNLTGLAGGVDLIFANLEPGESIELSWQTQFCQVDCSNNIPPLEYKFIYGKDCPPGQKIEGGGSGTFADSDQLMKDSVSFFIGRFLRTGNTYDFRYDLFSDLIQDSTGTLAIDFELPCMLDWTTNSMILDGQAPTNITVDNRPSGISTVRIEYQLPFSSDHVFTDFSLTFACDDNCLTDIDPDLIIPLTSCMNPEFIWSGQTGIVDSLGRIPIGVIGNLGVNVKSSFIPQNGPVTCGVSDCEEFGMLFVCGDSADLFTLQVPAYLDFNTQFVRENIGLQDNDDNREADSNNPANSPMMRRDRYIPGDTSVTKIEGTVINDVPGHTSNFIRFRLDFEGHLLDDGVDDGSAVKAQNSPFFNDRDSALFFRETGIKDLIAEVVIFDQSAGESYRCRINASSIEEDQFQRLVVVNTRPPDVFDEWLRLTYFYEIDLRNAAGAFCDLPLGFVLEEGDFVQLETKHVMIFNAGTRVLNLRQFSSVALFNTQDDIVAGLSCGRPNKFFQLSGYNVNRILGNFTSEPCGEFSESVGSGFNISLGMTNFFPYEVRTLAEVIDWDIILGPGFDLIESRIVNAGHDGVAARHRDVLLTPDIQGKEYKYDMRPFQNPPYDEGFYINLFHKFESEPVACSIDTVTPVDLHSRIEFPHNFPDLPDFLDDTRPSSLGIQPLLPLLVPDANNPISTSTDNTADWDFTITNDADHPSLNTWMVIESPSNLIFDFELTDNGTGQKITPNNNVFQLGDMDGRDINNYSLTANYELCGIDTLLLIYGWNCEPIRASAEFACTRDTFKLILEAPAGELEMNIESPTDSVQLCSTVPFHIVEVFNANLGSAFDLKLKALLPPGITVIPGSSEISYTTASGNFVQVPDPTVLGSGNYEWDISAIQNSIRDNGLPGVQNDPQHSVSLRFLGFTECGLIASAPIIFNISGTQGCGDPINTLTKPSDEINVKGVTADYETQIAAVGQPAAECGNNFELEIDIRVLGDTEPGDSIFITLPEGIDYISGSYAPGTSALADAPIIINRGDFDVLKWKMQSGLMTNSTISFSIETSGYGDLDCSDVVIQVQTVQSREALCISTNELCPVLVQTGSAFIQVEILAPVVRFDEFFATAGTGGADYFLAGTNIGANTGTPITVDFYLDNDGNGFLSPGDMLLDTQIFSGGLTNGQQFELTGTLNVDEDQFCTIIAVMDSDKNCSCSNSQLIVQSQQTASNVVKVCSEDVVSIGVNDNSNNVYSWDNPLNISCTNCSMVDFVFQNIGLDTVSFNYVLTDDNGSCPVRNLIKVIVYPEPKLLNEDTLICEGVVVDLITTPADSYSWQGLGITDSTLQNQSVSPSMSATYTVEIANDFGCSITDEVFIEVTPGPTPDAGQDTTLCDVLGGYRLETKFDSAYSYIWQPVFLLSDIFSHNPTITDSRTGYYIVEVTDRNTGCIAVDSVYIDFSEVPQLSTSGDEVICLGDTITMSVNGADEYEWFPSAGLDCGDCQFVTAAPSNPITYYVTGTNGNLCKATDSIFVDIQGEVEFRDSMHVGCEGDSIFIDGEWRTTDIIVTETQVGFDGCDIITTHNLRFIPDSIIIDTFICEGEKIQDFDGFIFENNEACKDTIFSKCESQICYNVIVHPRPNDSIGVDTTILIETGDSVQLSLPEGYANYFWTPTENLRPITTNSQSVFVSPVDSTVYSGTYSTENGCSVSSRFKIRIAKKCSSDNVEIPNIFSPNGDGINDNFELKTPNLIEEIVSMKIFSRWGQQMFEGAGRNASWDGTFKGERVVSDAYIYIIEVGCDEDLQEKRGDVTVYR